MRFALTVALLLAASSVFAANTASWNFDDGTTQGWTVKATSAAADPGIGNPNWLTFADTADGQYDAGTYNSIALWLPDTRFAYISTPFGATNSFTFTALVGYNFNGSTSRLQKAGLGYHDTAAGGDPWAVTGYFEGKASNSSEMLFRDFNAVGSAVQGQTGVIKNAAGSTPAQQAVWLTIDYNHLIAGQVVLQCQGENHVTYIENGSVSGFAAASPQSWTYNYALGTDTATGAIYTVDALRLGGDGSWAQVYADNVSFTDWNAAVPEPGSIMALGCGLVGLVGMVRRRK